MRPSTTHRASRAAFLASAAVLSTSASVRIPAPQADPIGPLALALIETAALPSLSIAILRDGEIVYANAWGYADIESRVAATADTRYRCGSVSKVLTATALGRMVQDGRLDLDAQLVRYVPTWPAEPTITARQLAGHLSGVAHYQGVDRLPGNSRHYDSVLESLEVFRDSPRAGVPGAAYAYSTHGYTLLSAAIEGAAGSPFLEVLDEEVFSPLGMTSSGPDLRASPHPRMATLYDRAAGQPRVPEAIAEPEDPSYKWAGGGLVSTPSDLVRLAWAYLDGFIEPGVVEEMWTSQRTSDGEETGVGITWRIERDDMGRRVIHHSGAMGGARATVAIFPDQGEAIAVMTNIAWPSDIHTIAKALMEAYRNAGITDAAIATDGPVAISGTVGDREAGGTLELADGAGWITTPASLRERLGAAAVERLPIRHVAGSRYLVVTPVAIVGLDIEERDGRIRGTGELLGEVWTFEGP